MDAERIDEISVKAVQSGDDWILEVRGIPFGSPNNRDADGEYFDANTRIHEDKFPLPPVVYYHGWKPGGGSMDSPEYIGKTLKAEKRADGWWFTVALDKGKQLAARVWDAARNLKAEASAGSVKHLARVRRDGYILEFPIAELTLLDREGGRHAKNHHAVVLPVLKAIYDEAGIDYPQALEAPASATDTSGDNNEDRESGKPKMDSTPEIQKQEIQKLVADGIATALKAQNDAVAAEAARQKEIKDAADAAVKAAQAEWEAGQARNRRLPSESGAPYVAKYGNLWAYDNLDPGEHALMVSVLQDGQKSRRSTRGASENAVKALAVKLIEDKTEVGESSRSEMLKANMPLKADEVQQQDLTGFGDEWVAIAWSNVFWPLIRAETFVLNKLPSIEVPAGHESIYLLLEGADPTLYKVPEVTDINATTGIPNATITSSQMATGRVQLTLGKIGARVLWSGELEEDSLRPFLSQLKTQLVSAHAEQLEYLIIDGDTATGATTNINHIGGTPGATDLYLTFNGFRKSPLVTTTANSRSGGTLTVEDYLETLKLMGTAGLNGLDPTKVSFIQDLNVGWKSLELPELKTRDVNSTPTIERGKANMIWGYDVFTSFFMHYKSATRKANTSGKVDQTTPGNNTTGSLLAVRWDQWMMGWRRRMKVETSRFAESDSTQIVLTSRLGMIQRDTEASAISYNITV